VNLECGVASGRGLSQGTFLLIVWKDRDDKCYTGHNPLCCFSTSVCVVSVYFVIDSVRKLLDTPSYQCCLNWFHYYVIKNFRNWFGVIWWLKNGLRCKRGFAHFLCWIVHVSLAKAGELTPWIRILLKNLI